MMRAFFSSIHWGVRSIAIFILMGSLLFVGCTDFTADPSQDGGSPQASGDATTAQPGTKINAVESRPNVWLITVDDMRTDDLRYMSNVRKLIAGKGFAWDNAFSTFPLCCPARASLITGQYAHNHGVLGNSIDQHGGYGWFKSHGRPRNTLGPWLQKAGYRTAFVGKYLNRYGEGNPRRFPPGWDSWAATLGASTYGFVDAHYNLNGRVRRVEGHDTNIVSRRTLKQMLRPSRKPLFVWSSYVTPHDRIVQGGWAPPKPLAVDADRPTGPISLTTEDDMSDKPSFMKELAPLTQHQRAAIIATKEARARALMGVDRRIGDTIRRLADVGLLRNTLIIFHSDNGYLLGEHRITHRKTVAYEEAVHVPLVMRGPGIPVGRSSVLVGLHDITPTILHVARATPGRVMDGVSLRRIARNQALYTHRVMLFETGNAYGAGGDLAVVKPGVRFMVALRMHRWVYIKYKNGEHELYDLKNDPLQLDSLHADPRYERIRRQLARELERLKNCDGRECNKPFRLRG